MTGEAAQIAERIRRIPKEWRSGTILVFGYWFGRPFDNSHQIVDAEADGSRLDLVFDRADTMRLWDPAGLHFGGKECFAIERASRVRWEWHLYGRSPTPENLRFEEYQAEATGVSRLTDFPGEAAREPRLSQTALLLWTLGCAFQDGTAR